MADTFGRLLEARSVFLRGRLDQDAATFVVAQLMTLDAESDDEITLYIHSGGGALGDLFVVTDTLALLRAPLRAVCIGEAGGTAAAVLAAASGPREATPSARVTLRQAEDDISGSSRFLERQADALQNMQDRLYDLLAAATGRSRDEIARDVEDGRWLTAEEAVRYGLVDAVVRVSGS